MKTTSLLGIFRDDFRAGEADEPVRIHRIEIPMIQRDYAQGRLGAGVTRIRRSFLGALRSALTSGPPITLDFIYGEVKDGRLIPLDGQQRLTTLFLLHWYVALRAGTRDQNESQQPGAFTYETRPSSRRFCTHLVAQQPPFPLPEGLLKPKLSAWLFDQPWFLRSWERDPTIRSMLVMLDEIHADFGNTDFVHAWNKLSDKKDPAVHFHFLAIAEIGGTDDLYIKMNSRGKPLTRFENHKARFEQLIKRLSDSNHRRFSKSIDNEWTDLLWPLRDERHLIDDRYMRLYGFVTEVIRWWLDPNACRGCGDLHQDALAARLYGTDNPSGPDRARANQVFLFDALDCWPIDASRGHTGEPFRVHFTAKDHEPGKVTLFGADIDLFAACCRDYVTIPKGRNPKFTFQQTLLLFAVMLHKMEGTADFGPRVRILRNLVFASGNEVRLDRMTVLLKDAAVIIRTGQVSGLKAFNRALVVQEQRKLDLLAAHPALRPVRNELEDHDLLRGQLVALDLSPPDLARRASTFARLFSPTEKLPPGLLTGALLACGDYSWQSRWDRFRLGPYRRTASWRDLMTGGEKRAGQLAGVRAALTTLLDAVAAVGPDAAAMACALSAVCARHVAAQDAAGSYDWRYYLVKYATMREGHSGYYVGNRATFDLCMLDATQLNSLYRDPFLSAIVVAASASPKVDVAPPWFTGAIDYAEYPGRWLVALGSGVAMSCGSAGFLLRGPTNPAFRTAFDGLCVSLGVGSDLHLSVAQAAHADGLVDTEDRVVIGANLLRAILLLRSEAALPAAP